MPVVLRDLSNLDAATVQDNLATIIQRVQEANPSLYLTLGIFNDLLGYYNALLGTQRQAEVADYLSARSLLDIQNNPALAEEDLVDAVLSTYRITRAPGVPAAGEVTIVVNSSITVTIAAGAVFQAQGETFLTTGVFTAKLEAAQISSPGDRLLTLTADGNYAFTVTVQATDTNGNGRLVKDTLIVPDVLPPNYVTSYVTSDFTGGLAPQTNAELVNLAEQGIAAKGAGNRVIDEAMLRANEAFSRVTALSIVGMGDPEMLRDRHSIFPVSMGGRTDWYVRTQPALDHLLLTKTATLIAVSGSTGTWQISLVRDDAPGFYEIANIRLPGSTSVVGGFNLVADVRGLDLTGPDFVPDIDATALVEGMFSRYQTSIIQFVDTVTNATALSIGAEQDYELEARRMPLLADIQSMLSAVATRNLSADVLVKAPVPCFVQLSFTINRQAGAADPDLGAIRATLVDLISTTGFIGRLYASRLTGAIQSHLQDATSVSAIDMLGRIRYPDGTTRYIRSAEVLIVPEDPGSMVSSKTVQFFVEPEDIAVTVVSVVPLNP